MFQSSTSLDASASAAAGEFTGLEPWYCTETAGFWQHAGQVPRGAELLDPEAFVELERDVPY